MFLFLFFITLCNSISFHLFDTVLINFWQLFSPKKNPFAVGGGEGLFCKIKGLDSGQVRCIKNNGTMVVKKKKLNVN